jgi:hypothetical protein
MLIGPRPDLPEPSDYGKLVHFQRRRHLEHRWVGVQIAAHFDPIASH